MALKAKLKIVLHANDTIVAVSEDPVLWQRVLVSINSPESEVQMPGNDVAVSGLPPLDSDSDTSGTAADVLAKQLGVEKNVLMGACSPSETKPFIYLDNHHWEALKKNTPARGSSAINGTTLAATLLVLWKSAAKLGDTNIKEAASVLRTINVASKNPSRSVKNCQWLQIRNSIVVLNPAETSKAIKAARAYCLKIPPEKG